MWVMREGGGIKLSIVIPDEGAVVVDKGSSSDVATELVAPACCVPVIQITRGPLVLNSSSDLRY